jgi:hypothetical protein
MDNHHQELRAREHRPMNGKLLHCSSVRENLRITDIACAAVIAASYPQPVRIAGVIIDDAIVP